MITSSAYRIGPFEVESVLVQHPTVVEAAVVGKDDPARTEIVTAFCTCPGWTGSPALATRAPGFVKRDTAPYKYPPREIHVVDEMLRTISGKIRRSELRGRQDKS